MNVSAQLNAEHVGAANSVYQELAAEGGIALAIVSGSLAFGLGHGASDVDLHVLPADGVELRSKVYQRGGFPVQVTVMSRQKFDTAAGWAAAGNTFTTRDRDGFDAADDVRKLAVRLSRGHLIHADAERKAALDAISSEVIRQRILARQAVHVGSHLEDVAGSLACGDLDTAYWAARIALTHAGEAALAAAGDLYVGPKFLLRRLRRTAAVAEVLPTLLVALDYPGEPVDDLVARIRSHARLAAYVSSAAVLGGWDSPLVAMRAPGTGSGGVYRDPFHTLLRFGDGIGLAGPDRGFKVTPDAARLWLELDGGRPPAAFGAAEEPARRGVEQLISVNAASLEA